MYQETMRRLEIFFRLFFFFRIDRVYFTAMIRVLQNCCAHNRIGHHRDWTYVTAINQIMQNYTTVLSE